ncbi:MAG: DUF2934 domain-containing protein [Sulfuritalea sp.]|nr:DUF2934 domain-containing protein [Sulfuritalea sp.]
MKITSGSVRRKGNGLANSAATMAGGWESPGVDESRLQEMIAVAAYYRAEQRGFAPGNELVDWIQAEAEFQTSARSPTN